MVLTVYYPPYYASNFCWEKQLNKNIIQWSSRLHHDRQVHVQKLPLELLCASSYTVKHTRVLWAVQFPITLVSSETPSRTCCIDRGPGHPLADSPQCPAITKPAPGSWSRDLLLLGAAQRRGGGGMTPTGDREARDTPDSLFIAPRSSCFCMCLSCINTH